MVSDPRAQQAREHQLLAGKADELATRHRQQRDQLVRALRAEDPDRWTYRALAAAVGCTHELISAILHGRTGPGADRPDRRPHPRGRAERADNLADIPAGRADNAGRRGDNPPA